MLPPGRVPPVRADRDRLVQVVLNLLSNAVKFIEPGTGRVAIALAEDGGSCASTCATTAPASSPETTS